MTAQADIVLSLVVPTLNEAGNIAHLIRRVARSLRGISYEVIVADDASTDGTQDLAEALSNRFPVRVLRRQRDFGLSAAMLDGFRHARGDLLAVIDADLQHDPAVLPDLVGALDDHEIAVASRYAFQGKTCGWSLLRELQSRLAASLTRHSLNLSVRDPLSGYFAIRRSTFEASGVPVNPRGWKLLLDILARAPDALVAEVPFTFRARRRGRTKMNFRVVASWVSQLSELRAIRNERRRTMAAQAVPS